MNRLVSVSGGGTGIGPAMAMHCAQRNAQVVIVIVGQRANVLEHAAEVIGGVFPDARPTVPGLPTWACLIRWTAFGGRWQSVSSPSISWSTRPARCASLDRWSGLAFNRACRPSCVPSGPNAATPAPHS